MIAKKCVENIKNGASGVVSLGFPQGWLAATSAGLARLTRFGLDQQVTLGIQLTGERLAD
jgi:hypothetical protein